MTLFRKCLISVFQRRISGSFQQKRRKLLLFLEASV